MICPHADASAAGFLVSDGELCGVVETLRLGKRGRAIPRQRRSFPKIRPLPGGLYAERKQCNRPNYRCAAGGDALHGPYLYRRWLENGRLRRQSVKPNDAEQVRAAREVLAELRRVFRQLDRLEV